MYLLQLLSWSGSDAGVGFRSKWPIRPARMTLRSFHGRLSSDCEGDNIIVFGSPQNYCRRHRHRVFHPRTTLETTQYINGVTRRKCTSDITMTDLIWRGPRRKIPRRHVCSCVLFTNRIYQRTRTVQHT